MKKYLLTAIGIAFSIYVVAQSSVSYRADLEKLSSVLKETPSFKDQIRSDRLIAYQALYDSLLRDSAAGLSDYQVFLKLAALFFPLRDNHLGFYQLPARALAPAQFGDSAAIRAYRSHSVFLNYPKQHVDLEALELALQGKPADSPEGIYYYGKYLKVGLFQSSPDEYKGIVLSTTLPNWEKGQIAIWLKQSQRGCFKAIYGHPVYKYLILYNNEKYWNRSLINSRFHASLTESVYTKRVDEVDYMNIDAAAPAFQFRQIARDIQYMRLGNFSVSEMNVSGAFINRIGDSLTAPHLIVDLRNNTGGAEKVSRKFLKPLKKYAKRGKVYLLVNGGTMSQGEIFTLQLKQLPNITIYGATTMGTLAYGSNYGKTIRLPSGKYQVYITDMRNGDRYLPYESIGVKPDVALGTTSDWLQQVVQSIEQ